MGLPHLAIESGLSNLVNLPLMDNPSPRAGLTLALIAALVFGVSGAVAGGLFDELSPTRVTEARAFAITLALLPYVIARGAPRIGAAWPALLAFGAVLAGVTFSFYWALDLLGVGPGATVQFVAPVFVLLWMRFVQHRAVAPIAWAASVTAVSGVAMVTQAWEVSSLDPLAVSAGLSSAVLFAAYLLLAEHLARLIPPVALTAYGFGIASVIWLFAVPVSGFPTDLSTSAWWKLGVVLVFGAVVPFTLEMAAVRTVPSGLLGVIATLEPVVAGAAAWVLLGQTLAPVQVVGSLLVAGSVAVISRFAL